MNDRYINNVNHNNINYNQKSQSFNDFRMENNFNINNDNYYDDNEENYENEFTKIIIEIQILLIIKKLSKHKL